MSIVVVALIMGYNASPWLRGQIASSVSRRATPFTELFFSNYAALPKHLSLLRLNWISFTIANHEGHRVDYHYIVTERGPGGSATEAGALTDIGNGDSVVQSVGFVPPKPNLDYRITVQLVGSPEFIEFHATS